MDGGTSAAIARDRYVEKQKEHPAAEIRNGVFLEMQWSNDA
ncbi:hypothetical protein SAMN04487917_101273 [Arthrobacter sp. yr096]|nr:MULTISPECIES: hypothetical protein [unclassified Arthrobacter]SDX19391.1 hypothetical protein SAMN04487912_108127 [Arthrobacter sp. cf158]SEI43565.1 hypothetical protein SAMN04487917_101273 [Arthrobacter sp. yr096]